MTLDELKRRTVVDVWPTAGQALGYRSKSAAYRAAARGDIPTLRLGERKLVVPTWQVLRMLGVEPSNGTNGSSRGANPGCKALPSPSDTATATAGHQSASLERGGGSG